MKRSRIVIAIATSVLLMLPGVLSVSAAGHSNADLKKRLAYCGSIPNSASLTVVETTRLFLFLPKDYFPNVKLKMVAQGASASAIYPGAYGSAQSKDAKMGCWSYGLDFELLPTNKSGTGTITIGSHNAFKSLSNYLIHFKVVVNKPSAIIQLTGNGNVIGKVLLGPICPVERNPPDPACAPRPYKSTIQIWNTLTGSAYQSVATDASGTFNLSLAPGSYSLAVAKNANGSPYPRCTQVNITVTARSSQNVTVNCDTGIR